MQRAPPQVVFGTAGHIDHGKSRLIEALTGTHPDRLPQERARGMSIELGFGFLPAAVAGDVACDLAFIDCPGHARFLRQAIAGIGAMRGCLLIVAADEGVQAQTLEHLELLTLLQVPVGRVLLSKADLVDDERLAELGERCAELVADTPLAAAAPLPVSAESGRGIAELRAWLADQARAELRAPAALDAPALLPVDRVFTVAGHGTVVTGTLLRGRIAVGDELAAHPGPRARVRGLQVRSLPVVEAIAGQRTAVNLAGVDRHALQRGCVLAPRDSLRPTRCVDVQLRVLPIGLRHNRRVQVHHGTAQVGARLVLVDGDSAEEGSAFGQLRLDEDCYLAPGDRLLLRRYSPPATLAAARVLVCDAPRHRRFSAATRRWFQDQLGGAGQRLLAWLERRSPLPAGMDEARDFLGGAKRLEQALAEAGPSVLHRSTARGEVLWSVSAWEALARELHAAFSGKDAALWRSLDALRDALLPDCPPAAFEDRLDDLQARGEILRDGRLLCLPAAVPPLPGDLLAAARALLADYAAEGLRAPYDKPMLERQEAPDRAEHALRACRERGWLMRIAEHQHLHRAALSAAVGELAAALADGGSVDVQWYKRALGLTRRHAVPLAEWCDRVGLTRRQGERRVAGARLRGAELPLPALGDPPAP